MNKSIICLLGVSLLWFSGPYYGSTTAPVTLAGAIIKSKHSDDAVVKYKRKDCPVCKGKGWYMSGDGIKKIECNYNCKYCNKSFSHSNNLNRHIKSFCLMKNNILEKEELIEASIINNDEKINKENISINNFICFCCIK
jgi:hypothetical protein